MAFGAAGVQVGQDITDAERPRRGAGPGSADFIRHVTGHFSMFPGRLPPARPLPPLDP